MISFISGSRSANFPFLLIIIVICAGYSSASGSFYDLHIDSKSTIVDFKNIKADNDKDGIADLVGDTVTVSGTANISTGILHENYMQVFIQNDSSGLSLFAMSFAEPIARGDSVVVTGVVQEYHSLVEVKVLDYTVYPGNGNIYHPKPLTFGIDQPKKYEGMLLEGEGTVIKKGTRYNGKYMLVSPKESADESIMVYVTNFHSRYADFDFGALSIGDNVRVTGVLSQYDPDPASGEETTYKIHLRTPDDLAIMGISTSQMILGGSFGLTVFAIIIGWVISLRSSVKSKTKELTESLNEKEILLKEIHHRVKNNLAIMSGLFELQLDGTENQETEKVIRNSQSRLQSMALVHDKLYQTSSLSDINMSQYIPELLKSLQQTFHNPDKDVEITSDIDAISLDIDRAIPCGLLINEIVVNAFKHAFTDQASGLISIEMHKRGDQAELIIADNGKGIPEDFDIAQSTSLGMMLIETFKQQIDGTLEIGTGEGTRYTLVFPVDL